MPYHLQLNCLYTKIKNLISLKVKNNILKKKYVRYIILSYFLSPSLSDRL